MRQLLEAGVHFGHQTRRWNPKMRPFIFAERNGIHIIDLAQTVKHLESSLEFVRDTVARGEYVLFVGTKKQAQEPIMQEANRAGQPFVNKRWLGGMLTNFTTIKKRISLLEQLEARQQAGDFERMTKKEAAKLTDEMTKLTLTVGGMRKMKRVPGAVFIIDPHRERIAVTEANKLEVPVVATGDTNVDPDEIDHIIPANDDAIRACRVVIDAVADVVGERSQRFRAEEEAARREREEQERREAEEKAQREAEEQERREAEERARREAEEAGFSPDEPATPSGTRPEAATGAGAPRERRTFDPDEES
jgi:small subunit ribosomal protein S2